MKNKTGELLYHRLIEAWNNRDASAFANCFADDSICIGFDGSEMQGKSEILTQLSKIFKDHLTAQYVTIIKEVKSIGDNVIVVRSHVGMVQPGKSIIESSKNAIQVMVAQTQNQVEKIILFQNTPAQFHGQPEVQASFTNELQVLIGK